MVRGKKTKESSCSQPNPSISLTAPPNDLKDNLAPVTANVCQFCKETCATFGFCCDVCLKWSHWKCDALDEDVCNLIAKKHRDRLLLVCSCCDVRKIVNSLTEINNLKKRISKLESSMDLLNTVHPSSTPSSFAETAVKVSTTSTTSQQLFSSKACKNDGKTTTSLSVHDEIEEALEQERRKTNIIIFNLPEVDSGDIGKVQKLLDHVTENASPAFECSRIGKLSPQKTRPLRVSFISESKRNSILKCLHKLQSLKDKPQHLNIAPDRTKHQQQEHQKLYAELIARRTKGEHVLIVNNKIVRDRRPAAATSRVVKPSPCSGNDDIEIVELPESENNLRSSSSSNLNA